MSRLEDEGQIGQRLVDTCERFAHPAEFYTAVCGMSSALRGLGAGLSVSFSVLQTATSA